MTPRTTPDTHDAAWHRGCWVQTARMARELATLRLEKDAELREVAGALHALRVHKEETEAQLRGALQQVESKRKQETQALRQRVTHLRDLQKAALEHVSGKARQASSSTTSTTHACQDIARS